MKNIFKKAVSTGLLGLLLSAGAAIWLVNIYAKEPLPLADDSFTYVVPPGGSLSQVATDFAALQLIPSRYLLMLYSRFTGRGHLIRVGEYRITRGDSLENILDKFERGDVIQHSLTIVEGTTFAQMLGEINAQARLKKDSPVDEVTLRKALAINADTKSLEGLFFPDTYIFYGGMPAVELLKQSYQRMQAVLQREWAARAEGLPYETSYDALIMASIVEKETGDPSERAQIAGVFTRRLQKGMRLQTDPTVIYGVGAAYDGNLRRFHLNDQNNRYNTYRHKGLPPTPIALPGEAAIHATLHPDSSDKLYFVAKGDGSHHFSVTLAEHTAAIKKYQIHRRASDYRSAPRKQ